MRDPGLNTRTTTASTGAQPVAVPERRDSLTAPAVDDMLRASLSLWPTGPAWGTPDGDSPSQQSVLADFTRTIISPFSYLYRMMWQLTREATGQGLDETLPRWENDYGLPDPCMPATDGFAERAARVRARIAEGGAAHPEDFVLLASLLGFVVEIEEPAIFECGFSECAGEHATGSPDQEVYWIVRVLGIETNFFLCGESELGRDPLFSVQDLQSLRCQMERVAPGWTIPIFDIEDLS